MRAPPPNPCRTLKNIRLWRFHEEPHIKELKVKRAMDKRR
jgi:hypothetical protein